MKILHNDDVCNIFHDDNLNAIYLEYNKKVANDDVFLKVNQLTLTYFKKLNTNKFVADTRKMGIIGIKSQKWVTEIMLPEMIKHLNGKQLHHVQLIDNKEILSKVSSSNIQKTGNAIKEGFEIVQFSNIEEMKQYLEICK